MLALHVRNWDAIFETAETRKLKRLSWLPLPNKQDGDGYCDLLDHQEGAAHLAAWTVILQLASKSGRRGWLLRETGAGIVPHDAKSIARITRIPEAVIASALPRLLSIGWLESKEAPAGAPADDPAIPGEAPGIPSLKGREGKGPEEKGREGERTDLTPTPPVPSGHGEGAPAAAPEARQGETKRQRFLALLKRYGATMTMKGDDLTSEWLNAANGYRLDWIEHLFATSTPMPHLPSKLRAMLKLTAPEYETWRGERTKPQEATP